ncbi:hypothetical protein COEREDRAFT_83317 [Coemansia reversa NRRL 1564]|uniref:Uncharacterized protein n=1 Tax=Coemansia reversa (strain ATCC 12441 / NRRL 1564) TaxID=763665 RepID=A0A2G5B4S6_COERN|nr:hypothetical protein COEREDRAFT_83317 [Coemansia reversa NRRL 1564]|eukprot:PIA13717.1 hypothetical protein COEREDRAFT_83317 [Coemansia reversa NRRL 1564]
METIELVQIEAPDCNTAYFPLDNTDSPNKEKVRRIVKDTYGHRPYILFHKIVGTSNIPPVAKDDISYVLNLFGYELSHGEKVIRREKDETSSCAVSEKEVDAESPDSYEVRFLEWIIYPVKVYDEIEVPKPWVL